jgi:hypothetical protein
MDQDEKDSGPETAVHIQSESSTAGAGIIN